MEDRELVALMAATIYATARDDQGMAWSPKEAVAEAHGLLDIVSTHHYDEATSSMVKGPAPHRCNLIGGDRGHEDCDHDVPIPAATAPGCDGVPAPSLDAADTRLQLFVGVKHEYTIYVDRVNCAIHAAPFAAKLNEVIRAYGDARAAAARKEG